MKFRYFYSGVEVKDFGAVWLKENCPKSKAASLIRSTPQSQAPINVWAAICADTELNILFERQEINEQ